MKISSISIQGFRGFNEARTIDFHDRLTLVYARNSYGKTSISEALEWLLYGITSKLLNADYSKTEYKGSYRNPHFQDDVNPSVTAIFSTAEKNWEFCGELTGNDGMRKFLDGIEVSEWSPLGSMTSADKPFILQHSLKELLLVEPAQRFAKFAEILGLKHIDTVQKDIVSLCTKYESAIPDEVVRLTSKVHNLQSRVQTVSDLSSLGKCFKAKKTIEETLKTLEDVCMCLLPGGTKPDSLCAELTKLRDESVGKLFEGSMRLDPIPSPLIQRDVEDEQQFAAYVCEELLDDYLGLCKLSTVESIVKRAQFLRLGLEMAEQTPDKCPFCGKVIDEQVMGEVRANSEAANGEAYSTESLQNTKGRLERGLGELLRKIDEHHARYVQLMGGPTAAKDHLDKLEKLLLPKYQDDYDAIVNASQDMSVAWQTLHSLWEKARKCIIGVRSTLGKSNVDLTVAKELGMTLVDYVASARQFREVLLRHSIPVSKADRALQAELDALAGTEKLSVLMELLQEWPNVLKVMKMDAILDSLKELRKTSDQFAGSRMLEAVSGEFTSDVMKWYAQIKTQGDPEVHFQGFDMERSANGELKSRRVQINASSYGKGLASAVSSLSESKLNALGLCVSIATSLRGKSPFDFLIIDDPIQSWDADHETKFIDVIRDLAESGKQIILLSHNEKWLKQVKLQCASINGWYYEITGYSKEGPHIRQCSWDEWHNRLSCVDAILKDATADNRKLQQAEEEIRIVVGDLSSQLYLKKTGTVKNANRLNSKDIKKMLMECGIESRLVDRIVSTFGTTDDSHHNPSEYTPNRERIRSYHAWAHDLAKCLDN